MLDWLFDDRADADASAVPLAREVALLAAFVLAVAWIAGYDLSVTWAWAPPAEKRPAEAPPAEKTRAAPTRAVGAGALRVPVEGVAPGDLRDSFAERRSGGRTHRALDIMAPAGTPVVAAAPGVIVRRHRSARGGRSLYQLSADSTHVFYYAHLRGYAAEARPGARVEAGDRLGYVGATGNARTPHLHFAVWRVADPARPWSGPALNPYDLLTDSEED